MEVYYKTSTSTGSSSSINTGGASSTRRGLVVDLHFADDWVVGSTEVVATCRASITTRTTDIGVSNVAVRAASTVSNLAAARSHIVATAPGGTVTARAIGVVAISITIVPEVVGQREQEAARRAVIIATTAAP